MFTVEQIKAAHSKVKSGSDFPKFVEAIMKLGVLRYDTSVTDGHTDYYGAGGFKASSDAAYEKLVIANNASLVQFAKDLKEHQGGKTDYATFCNTCAQPGVAKWIVAMDTMTCTCFDQAGNTILVEKIAV